MNAQMDLPDQADVYSHTPHTARYNAAVSGVRRTVTISVERSAMALGRVFGLLGTVSMVPLLSRTSSDDQVIDLYLEFSDADSRKFELLYRKLERLTETISLRIGPD